ncbi:MAG: AMP-binding protein, partial [Burkholderiales bacterium]|nr:AMP-binding protein [Burkholderiales bacterium]
MSDSSRPGGTVSARLARRVAETPEANAFLVESEGGRWQGLSWAEFGRRVARLRAALAAAGLKKGDRIALIAPVSLEWELLHHAALGLGAVVVGLDAHDLPARVAEMVELAGISAFATADPRVLEALRPQRLAAATFVLMLGHPASAGPPGVRCLDWNGLDALAENAANDAPPPVATDLATLIFTSGTTGAPKAIAYSHGQLVLAIDAICDAFAFVGAQARMLCWLPLSNLFQRVVNLAALRQGASTYLLADPRRVMEVVATVAPDIFVGVPRFYEKLYDGIRANIAAQPPGRARLANWAWDVGRRASRRRLEGRPLPPGLRLAQGLAERLVLRKIRAILGNRLRCMVTGSAPMPRLLLEEFHALGWIVLEAYGLSEDVMPMAMNRLDDFRFGTVGRPMPGNEVVIAADGTVKVRGPGLFAGYWADPGPPPFDAEGYYATGDLGRFDDEGYLSLTGRSGEMIKTSTGRRIAPAGIEAQLRGVPGLDQVLLVGNGRKALIALCTLAAPFPDAGARERF